MRKLNLDIEVLSSLCVTARHEAVQMKMRLAWIDSVEISDSAYLIFDLFRRSSSEMLCIRRSQ